MQFLRAGAFLLQATDGMDITTIVTTFLPFLLIIVVFYFFMIRPESKRKKATQKMRDELAVGDEVTTIGGIVGKIVSIKDDRITIETGSDRTKIQALRWAISSKGEQSTDESAK